MPRPPRQTCSAYHRCWNENNSFLASLHTAGHGGVLYLMTTLTDLTLHEASTLLREGKTSSLELTEACLTRMEALDSGLQSFITSTPELARAAARQADEGIAAWRKQSSIPLHPLTGIPLAIKDVLCVQGTRTTAASRILDNFIAPYT